MCSTFGEVAGQPETVGMIDFHFELNRDCWVKNITVKYSKVRDSPTNIYKVHYDVVSYIKDDLFMLLYDIVPQFRGEAYQPAEYHTQPRMIDAISRLPDEFVGVGTYADESTAFRIYEKTTDFDVFYFTDDNGHVKRITFVVKTMGG